MSGTTRREFLKKSLAAAGGALAAGGCGAASVVGDAMDEPAAPAEAKAAPEPKLPPAPEIIPRRAFGANDTIHVGVAGIHGRGGSHIGAFSGMKNVEVTHLIDPDSRLFGGRAKSLEKKQGKAPKCVQDVRHALEDKDLDVISIATCNHWHSLMSIWACQTGKDVYVEKPLSHNVYEGRKLVEAARRHNRIVQHGTQRRSSSGWAKAAACARAGKAGKLTVSYGWASKPRSGIGHKKTEAPPKELDFSIWLGPAPEQPYHSNLVHYNWHWFWAFGNADTGNQGVHQMDVARWGLPDDAVEKQIKVMSLGGRFDWNDQGETPNAHLTIFDYGEYMLIFESCNLVTGKTRNVSNAFHTEDGVITDGRFTSRSGKRESLPEVEYSMGAGGGIFDNFIKAVRSGKHTDLQADVLEGHLSSLLCHVGAACYRLGEVVPFDRGRRAFGDNKVAYDALEKMEDRMKSRGVKIDESLKYRVGPALTFDQKTEQFTGDRADEANRLITREYREPFVVPERV